MHIAKRIETLRLRCDWTFRELSQKMGVTESQLSRIEGKKFTPSWATLAGLALAFDMKLEELLEGVEFTDDELPPKHPKRQVDDGVDFVKVATIAKED